MAVPETQVATFECEVSHFNVPSTWLRDGVEVEMSEKFSIVVSGKLHQLKIMNSSAEDSAEYTFVCGNDRVSAMLTVNCKLLHFSVLLHSQQYIWFHSADRETKGSWVIYKGSEIPNCCQGSVIY